MYTFKFPNKLIAKLNLKSFVKYFNESEHLLDYFVNSVMDKYYVISNIYKNTTQLKRHKFESAYVHYQ